MCRKTKKYLCLKQVFFVETDINYFLEVLLLVLVFAELDFAADLVEDFLQEQAELEFEQELLP